MLVFMLFMSRHPAAMRRLAPAFPWQALVVMLNSLLRFYKTYDRIERDDFPWHERDDLRPFPEDWAMRGMFWTEGYWPLEWFKPDIEAETHYMEQKSMKDERSERIIWLGYQLAKSGKWLVYNQNTRKFVLPGESVEDISENETESNAESTTVMADEEVQDVPMAQRAVTWKTTTTTESDMTWETRTEDTAWDEQDSHPGDRMDLEGGSISTEIPVLDDPGGKG